MMIWLILNLIDILRHGYLLYNLVHLGQMYCLFLSAFSTVFLLYLCIVVATGSETLYLEVHNNAASAVALFISSLVYAGITAYVYYDVYMNVDRKEELKRWIREERLRKGTELASYERM